MQSEYFDAVGRDLEKLTLLQPIRKNQDWTSYSVSKLPAATFDITKLKREAVLAAPPQKMDTEVGQIAMDALTADDFIEFNRAQSWFMACAAAEMYLLESMRPDAYPKRSKYSPLILTMADTPVAIMKDVGERSCYALETVEEAGLVEATFAAPSDGLLETFTKLAPAKVARKRPFPEDETVTPMRFGAFIMSSAERTALLNKDSQPEHHLSAFTTHDMLKEQVEEMLTKASGPSKYRQGLGLIRN